MRIPILLTVLAGITTSPTLGQPAAVPVSVATPEPVAAPETLRLTGTLTARRHARLSPRVDGLVAEILADAGDRVEEGDVLLELDAALAQHGLRRAEAAVAEARAALAEAERLIDEARPLIAERHFPETELARREAEAELARARLTASRAAAAEQAELLRRHVLPAPFGGVIARRMTDVGEWIVRGTPVLELVATETVWLDVRVPQESFARIDESASVSVTIDALPGKSFMGEIAARVPISDPAARSFLFRIAVDGSGVELPPGASATAVLGLTGSRQALAVPRAALRRYPDGSLTLFVVGSTNGTTTARERRVTIGGGGEQVEILQGLEPDARVVVRGHDALSDGQAVRIADES